MEAFDASVPMTTTTITTAMNQGLIIGLSVMGGLLFIGVIVIVVVLVMKAKYVCNISCNI